jgi:hypothetical protein
MGYTHYWKQLRSFTKPEWKDVIADVKAIVSDVQHVQGIALADGMGDGGTQPEFTPNYIMFNGVGEDAHETFRITRKPDGGDFCKTAQKPYDLAVTAVLCYLATVTETHHVTSDGHGREWLEGLAEARRALPRYSNRLDIPRPILEDDRWISPWPYLKTERYRFNFCVDGRAYIIRKGDGKSYCFPTHVEAGAFYQKHKDILNASGYFDEARNKKLKRQQDNLLGCTVELAHIEGRHLQKPPSMVRPGEFPAFEERRFADLDGLLASVR